MLRRSGDRSDSPASPPLPSTKYRPNLPGVSPAADISVADRVMGLKNKLRNLSVERLDAMIVKLQDDDDKSKLQSVKDIVARIVAREEGYSFEDLDTKLAKLIKTAYDDTKSQQPNDLHTTLINYQKFIANMQSTMLALDSLAALDANNLLKAKQFAGKLHSNVGLLERLQGDYAQRMAFLEPYLKDKNLFTTTQLFPTITAICAPIDAFNAEALVFGEQVDAVQRAVQSIVGPAAQTQSNIDTAVSADCANAFYDLDLPSIQQKLTFYRACQQQINDLAAAEWQVANGSAARLGTLQQSLQVAPGTIFSQITQLTQRHKELAALQAELRNKLKTQEQAFDVAYAEAMSKAIDVIVNDIVEQILSGFLTKFDTYAVNKLTPTVNVELLGNPVFVKQFRSLVDAVNANASSLTNELQQARQTMQTHARDLSSFLRNTDRERIRHKLFVPKDPYTPIIPAIHNVDCIPPIVGLALPVNDTAISNLILLLNGRDGNTGIASTAEKCQQVIDQLVLCENLWHLFNAIVVSVDDDKKPESLPVERRDDFVGLVRSELEGARLIANDDAAQAIYHRIYHQIKAENYLAQFNALEGAYGLQSLLACRRGKFSEEVRFRLSAANITTVDAQARQIYLEAYQRFKLLEKVEKHSKGYYAHLRNTCAPFFRSSPDQKLGVVKNVMESIESTVDTEHIIAAIKRKFTDRHTQGLLSAHRDHVSIEYLNRMLHLFSIGTKALFDYCTKGYVTYWQSRGKQYVLEIKSDLESRPDLESLPAPRPAAPAA